MDALPWIVFSTGVVGYFVGVLWSWKYVFTRNVMLGCASLMMPAVLWFVLLTNLKETWRQLLLLFASAATMIIGYHMQK